uniref:Uncharacterized protein n=1 Tax=Panagrolaimus sp. PS1159 TaxID=55785 RepID=A0AC35FTI6_9BILA
MPKNEIITSELLKRIESCDINDLSLANQNITFFEYLKLVSSKKINELFLDFVKIIYEDGTAVPLDRILAQVPTLNRLVVKGDFYDDSKFNSETAKKLSELPKFENLWVFELHDISDAFNVDDFCNFILKHKSQKVEYYLYLRYPSTKHEYTRKFYAAMNKIIEEWNGKFEILIMINGLEYPFEC